MGESARPCAIARSVRQTGVREPKPSDYVSVRAAESRMEFIVAGAFTLLLAGTLAYVHHLFAEIAPPAEIWSWTLFTSFVIAAMVALPLAVWRRKPTDAEVVRIWSPLGKLVAILFDIAVASSVWLLLPYASDTLRLLMVVFYAAAISGQVISTAESLGTIAFGVVTIFGSAATFFLSDPGPYSIPLALFLLVFGALMVGVAAVLKVAIRSAIRARLKAEAVSADLAVALAAVTEARDTKTRFIAAATHDLRQPLQAAALFFNRLVTSKDEFARERMAGDARLAFDEAAGLLDRLLEHLRLDSGTVQASLGRTVAGDIIMRVTQEVALLAAADGIRLRAVASSAPLLCDAPMTMRIVRNLIHNAIRHSRGARVLVGAHRAGDRVRLYVIDDGRGVMAADREMLFTEFAQGPAGAERPGGIGLGLASSRRMAALMDGRVDLDTRWLRGAAFFVDLPCG